MTEPGYKNELEKNFSTYQGLINDAKDAHSKLLKLLPVEENENHEIWFKAKLLSVNEFNKGVAKYRTCANEKMNEQVDNPA